MHRFTKIGSEVAHVTRDSDTTFKVKRSKVKVTRPLYTSRRLRIRQLQRWLWENVFTVGTYCYVAVRRGRLGGARRFGAHRGRRGAGEYCGGSRTACCSSSDTRVSHLLRLSSFALLTIRLFLFRIIFQRQNDKNCNTFSRLYRKGTRDHTCLPISSSFCLRVILIRM